MNRKKSKLILILAWLVVVPVFVAGQVSFWQGMTQTAYAGTEADKRNAIAALATYKNAADYRAAEQIALANAITDGNTAITNAVDTSGVKTALNNAESVIDAIKTDAALTASEAASDKQAAADAAKSNISDLQKKMDKAQAARDKLAQSLGQIQKSVSIVKLDINNTKSVINDTVSKISTKEQEVNNLNNQIALQKKLLTNFIQQAYYNQNQPLLALVLNNANFSDVFSNSDHLLTIDDKIKDISDKLSANVAQLEGDKAALADAKQQHEKVLASKVVQQQALVVNQNDVQGQIQKQDATISEIQSKLSKLKSDLSSLLGMVVSTNDVKEAAGIASDATGVRKSFILGELTQESGLGRYTGGCTYKNTKVKPADATAFKDIMKELGYDINSKKISCAGKIGYGGAMGIAQFMPTTWLGYKSYIAGATGHNPPDPWSVIDGVMGMAKKLANAGATSKKGEYAASMIYYCGTSKPSNSAIKAACNNYAANVQSLTNGYENNK